MLYEIAHVIRDRFGFIWECIEAFNSFLFRIRYNDGLKQIPEVLKSFSKEVDNRRLVLRLAEQEDAKDLASFFAKQPVEGFTYFNPHSFDEKTLSKLIKRTSFIAAIAMVENEIVGYFFLRSFFHGRCYLGKMVDASWQGKGVGKVICAAAMDVATALGIRMFESINKKNPASMRSSSVLRQVVVKELENDDLLIEDFPLNKD